MNMIDSMSGQTPYIPPMHDMLSQQFQLAGALSNASPVQRGFNPDSGRPIMDGNGWALGRDTAFSEKSLNGHSTPGKGIVENSAARNGDAPKDISPENKEIDSASKKTAGELIDLADDYINSAKNGTRGQGKVEKLQLRHISENAALQALFASAKNPSSIASIFEDGHFASCLTVTDMAVNLSILRNNGEDENECAAIDKQICELIGKAGLDDRSAFAGWTPKNNKFFKEVNKLSEHLAARVHKLMKGADIYKATMEQSVMPALIAYLNEELGELTPESKKSIEAADGLLSKSAYEAVQRNLNLLNRGGKGSMSQIADQWRLAMTTTELMRTVVRGEQPAPVAGPAQAGKPDPMQGPNPNPATTTPADSAGPSSPIINNNFNPQFNSWFDPSHLVPHTQGAAGGGQADKESRTTTESRSTFERQQSHSESTSTNERETRNTPTSTNGVHETRAQDASTSTKDLHEIQMKDASTSTDDLDTSFDGNFAGSAQVNGEISHHGPQEILTMPAKEMKFAQVMELSSANAGTHDLASSDQIDGAKVNADFSYHGPEEVFIRPAKEPRFAELISSRIHHLEQTQDQSRSSRPLVVGQFGAGSTAPPIGDDSKSRITPHSSSLGVNLDGASSNLPSPQSLQDSNEAANGDDSGSRADDESGVDGRPGVRPTEMLRESGQAKFTREMSASSLAVTHPTVVPPDRISTSAWPKQIGPGLNKF